MVRVYLGDLGYYNNYNFTQPGPLNVAYLGAYSKQFIPELDIELFKNPAHLFERLSENPPDIIALSNYQWNDNLNTYLVGLAKSLNPNLITVLGGPHFNGVDPERAAKFFVDHPQVDYYIEREGEETFRRLLETLIANGLDPSKVSADDWPCTLFSYDHGSESLIHDKTGAFDRLDLLLIAPIYAASEPPIEGVTSALIARRIEELGDVETELTADFDTAAGRLSADLEPGDTLITLGAGDVWQVGDAVLKDMKQADAA